jgi:hypothetical protein
MKIFGKALISPIDKKKAIDSIPLKLLVKMSCFQRLTVYLDAISNILFTR